MKFNNILIVESGKVTQNHKESVKKIKLFFENIDISYTWISSYNLSKDLFNEKDLVITVGGDGLFIRVSHFVRDLPLLGINSDPETSEGALKELSVNNLEKLKKILDGEYDLIERTRARVFLNNELIKELALNEVYVGVENQFHTSRYIINYGGEKEFQKSSGIVIATGTGSSAWYNSAGGKLFEHNSEELKFLVREPFQGQLFSPKILSGKINIGEEISVESKKYSGGVIAIDAMHTYSFNEGDIVRVKVSRQKLNVVKSK